MSPAPEVPAYQATVLGPKQHDHCIVIPVINEGERIRAQLGEMAQLPFDADVLIADGGSTDGSLDPGWLQEHKVHALLVKTGPGKLSAQLRMGFFHALQEGYQGIVTVDGNAKDGVEAIPRFIAALQEGFDLIQGSRYRPGGGALHTPLDRTVAVRLIHAPITSVAAGFWYTDTTNGFRGYSRKLLEDPRVQPFRDVFDTYNLHFYLSVRAPRLGFRVTELGVRRCYPAHGPTPTKISKLSVKLDMLKQLFGAAFGAYDPPQ